MLKRLLCTVFLAVFCFGNVAYGMSNEAVRKRLETTLRRESGPIIKYAVREDCSKSGLIVPEIFIKVQDYSYEEQYCYITLEFSSYVPAETVKSCAELLCPSTAFFLKSDGVDTRGLVVVVLPCEFGNGIKPYDGQAVLCTGGELNYKTIPKQDVLFILSNMKKHE